MSKKEAKLFVHEAKMQVLNSNNIKIYNVSYGKTLPEWLTDRKRRKLQKKNTGFQLIQDFEMPDVSTGVKISQNGKYILVTGLYKPRVRCYDVDNIAMKFERCFNSEAVQFQLLEDDYSKFVLLQCDRTIEFHAKYGSYYQTRIPKFGRDLTYHRESCDLYVVGASPEAYRFNLEQGRFLYPLQTNASSLNKICINPVHNLISCGTMEGTVESFDPRTRHRIGILDCALSCVTDNTIINGFPSVTALHFKDALTMAVGTFTGQILMFDIRTKKPFVVKDHMYGLPIKNIEFIKSQDLIASMDPKCVKIWNQTNGKPFTAIQAATHLNDMCFVPNTGLLFLASEEKRMQSYFIPSIGPAPKWCSNLDNATEELEETQQDTVYDDYKFVTKKELEELHLEHLQGTNLLRAYMHGYFMDIRLYNKAKAIAPSTTYKDIKMKMVRSKIDDERSQVIVKQLPVINKEYAQKLMEKKINEKLKDPNPYEDARFKDMFHNPDFTMNEGDDEYERVRSTVDKPHKKKVSMVLESDQLNTVGEEENRKDYTSSEDEISSDGDSSPESEAELDPSTGLKEKLFEAKDSERFSILKKDEEEEDRESMLPLGDRVKNINETVKQREFSAGDKVVTFSIKKKSKHDKKDEERKAHLQERAKFRRPVRNVKK